MPFINLFSKIKLFFKSLFYKETKKVEEPEKIINETNQNKTSFIENLVNQTDIDNACEKDALEYIVEEIENNPASLDNLSTEKLEDINNYYDKKIQEVDKELCKLKNNN